MKMKTYLQDWLEDHGYRLGYNNDDRKPQLDDIDWIVKDGFKAVHYFNPIVRDAHMTYLRIIGRID